MSDPDFVELGDGGVFDRETLIAVLDRIVSDYPERDRIVAGLSVIPEPDGTVTVAAKLDSESAGWTRIGTFDLDDIRVR